MPGGLGGAPTNNIILLFCLGVGLLPYDCSWVGGTVRVIAGTAKGRPLKAPGIPGVRPTSDLVRGAIFDMIGPFFGPETRALDLFAGSGALGIEALSRGAGWVDFVEQQAACCRMISANLAAAGLLDRGRVHCSSVAQSWRRLAGRYDVILLDPPYAVPAEDTLFGNVAEMLGPDGVVVYEHAHRSPAAPRCAGLGVTKERRHGDTTITLYRMEGAVVG
ncbi:MAG: 16S rRNA (guanine(966)-N(2))-methyltransferase RsmD [Dehalococcoidia bacterium]|nr:16S rRNA (guanine(966)-N(2))-methyltransferase RsmD [Dehalococcoidia bacterium]